MRRAGPVINVTIYYISNRNGAEPALRRGFCHRPIAPRFCYQQETIDRWF
jgi:hypothetical protein